MVIEDDGRKEIDIKRYAKVAIGSRPNPHTSRPASPLHRYAKVEKIPGGDIEDSRVLKGVMFNKDVVHGKMRRRIEKPRILLLDCTLEYKKGESQASARRRFTFPPTPAPCAPSLTADAPPPLRRRTSSSRTTRRGRSCSARRRTTSRRSATRSSPSSPTSSSPRRASPTSPRCAPRPY